MGELLGQRSQLIADQPVLQGADPRGIDQRLGQVFVHLTRPTGEQVERALALALRRAVGGGLSGEPQLGADERQQRPGRGADGIKLRFDEAVAGVHLAVLHQPLPTLHPLRVAPDKGDVVGEGAVDRLVVGIAKDAACGGDEFGVRGIGQHPVPAVGGDPTGAGHAPFALVIGIAARHGADGLHRDGIAVDQREVLRGRHIVGHGIDRLLHRFRAHHLHRGGERGVLFGKEG